MKLPFKINFNKKKESVFFHEDFYKMKELLPEENYFATNKYISDLPNENSNEYGYTNINIISKQPIQLKENKISFKDVEDLLNPISLSFFNKVESGFGNTTYVKSNTVVWGFERFGIFVEFQNNSIQNIWLCESHLFSTSNNGYQLQKALNLIGKNYKLILADWDKGIVIRISSLSSLKKYLTNELMFEN